MYNCTSLYIRYGNHSSNRWGYSDSQDRKTIDLSNGNRIDGFFSRTGLIHIDQLQFKSPITGDFPLYGNTTKGHPTNSYYPGCYVANFAGTWNIGVNVFYSLTLRMKCPPPIPCPRLEGIAKGHVYQPAGKSIKPNAIAVNKCNCERGFRRFRGSASRTCNGENGAWSGSAASCSKACNNDSINL